MDAATVVGAGGIGCAVGYALAAAGVDVTFVEADMAKVDTGRVTGVTVDDRASVHARFVHCDDWLPDPESVIWLCTKCYDNSAVLKRIPPGSTVVPVQNGFDEGLDQLRHRAEGIASFVSECHADRPATRITRRGALHLGLRGHGDEPRVSKWAQALQQTELFRVVTVPDVRPFKNTKLMYNAAISPLAAAAGLDNGSLLRLPTARRLFFRLLTENYDTLTRAGAPLATIGPFHPSTVRAILRRPVVARAMAWAFYPGLRGTYCSMAGEIQKGRTELDNYTGHLLRLAGDSPCPTNRRVYDVVSRLVRERANPSLAVLNELADGVGTPGAAANDLKSTL